VSRVRQRRHGDVDLHKPSCSRDVYFYTSANSSVSIEYPSTPSPWLGHRTGIDLPAKRRDGAVQMGQRVYHRNGMPGDDIISVGQACDHHSDPARAHDRRIASGGFWSAHFLKNFPNCVWITLPFRGHRREGTQGMYGVVNEGGTALAKTPEHRFCGKSGARRLSLRCSQSPGQAKGVQRQRLVCRLCAGGIRNRGCRAGSGGEHGRSGRPDARDVVKTYYDKKNAACNSRQQ